MAIPSAKLLCSFRNTVVDIAVDTSRTVAVVVAIALIVAVALVAEADTVQELVRPPPPGAMSLARAIILTSERGGGQRLGGPCFFIPGGGGPATCPGGEYEKTPVLY